ncbi:MAG: hypothetical protein GY699_21595 [Desulfobacteraceae bacterium]|nr:hypothetical protein [Desulfobacteraceae bacterium]
MSVIPYNFYSPIGGVGIIVPVIPVGGESKSDHSESPMHLSIELEVEDGFFVLEPSKIILLYNGHEYTPVKMSRKYGSRSYRRSHSAGAVPGHCWECAYIAHRLDPKEMQDINEVTIRGKSCFMFEFEVKTIHPKENFSLDPPQRLYT